LALDYPPALERLLFSPKFHIARHVTMCADWAATIGGLALLRQRIQFFGSFGPIKLERPKLIA
jgi:hypothetical protein